MATEQEVFELVYKYIGEAEARRLADHLDQQRAKSSALEDEIEVLNNTYAAGAVSLQTFTKEHKQLTSAIAEAEKSSDRYVQTVHREALAVESAAAKQAAAEAKKAAAAQKATKTITDGTSVARQGFVDISRATQDYAQGGFSAIVNNLEGIGRGLPAILKNPMALLTSLPSILTFVGVAFLALGPKIAEFISWLAPKPVADFGTQIDLLADKLKKLKDIEAKTSIDTREIDIAERKLKRLTEAQAKYDADQKQQTVAEAESGKQIAEAVKESPTGAPGVGVKIAEQFRKEKEQTNPEFQGGKADKTKAEEDLAYAREVERLGGDATALIISAETRIEAAEKVMRDASLHITTESQQAAGDLKKQVEEGHGRDQAAARQEYVERLGRAGEQPLANQVAGMTPQAVKDKKAAIEAAENDKAAKEVADKAAHDKAVAQKKIDDDREKAHKEADRKALAEARIRVLNPEQTVALHGAEALEAAQGLIESHNRAAGHADDAGMPRAPGAGGGVAPVPLGPLGAAGAGGGVAPVPLGPLGAPGVAPAALPEFAPEARPVPRGRKGTALRRAKQEAKVKAYRAAKLTRTTQANLARTAKGRVIAAAGPPRQGPAPPPIAPAETPRQHKGRVENRAQQVFQQSQALTGQQFTPDQARATAEESFKLQAKGLDVNTATLTAMQASHSAMVALFNKLNQQGAAAGQMGRAFGQVANAAEQMGPPAANVGN